MRRAVSPPHLKVASINVQEIRVANRIEFSNAVSLNAAIVQKILSRLQTASKDIALLQVSTQNEINAIQANLGTLATETQNNISNMNDQISNRDTIINQISDQISNKDTGVLRKINNLAYSIDILNMQADSVETRLSNVESAMNNIQNLVSTLNLTDFVDLLPRVVAAETTIININTTLQILGDEIKSVTDLLSSSIVIF
jgi:predicted  nucleic acid-binding Zn-ribbon protein